jgi:CO/xanthine dehydrogenase FAD-binding subunit
MRAHVPSYELVVPRSLKDALRRLATEPGRWRPFAGGTDLMVLLEAGQLAHREYLSLWGLEELQGIRTTSRRVSIGALTTYSRVLRSPVLASEFPMLGQAARETGAIAIQNRGTLGGNIANASPAADSPPALLCYDAELELISAQGTRRVPYSHFHTGYKKTALKPGELIYRIHLPRSTRGLFHYYRKVGTRKAQAISKVCFAGTLGLDGQGVIRHARVALGSVAAQPLRCPRIEAAMQGSRISAELVARLRAELGREIAPIDDIRSTSEYRLRVAGNLLEEFLASAAAGRR